jgi:filamentous hemagglutinin
VQVANNDAVMSDAGAADVAQIVEPEQPPIEPPVEEGRSETGAGATNPSSSSDGPSETARFSSEELLNGHFEDHGSDFGATTASEYEQQASDFLTNQENPDILEFERVRGYRAGDTVRFNPETDEFGVISPDGSIRTYYRPDPNVHGFATNPDYFNFEREKTGE